ncbi:hypothetical protein EOD42_02920 [Rhodovarius crocodyli]|uniref:Uncharacterized protein n=1 Tax=Rhodovarius crocodyli TaxID=1979269 RepID=A0A437MN45_9PROT|nr:hypothetical protein [Rhodovarius crocodyli]RVT99075.1 hypothetical protein EOD42_02920 [Rhodovarius crocodyli]
MTLEADLIRCADAYCAAKGIARATLSTLLMNDGRSLERVAIGGSLTVRIWQRSMSWLSANWPDGEPWPDGVARPDPQTVVDGPRHRPRGRPPRHADAAREVA